MNIDGYFIGVDNLAVQYYLTYRCISWTEAFFSDS